MLYTGKGDNGTTKLFNCPEGVRMSKSALVFEALGTLDELNSMLGFAKTLAQKSEVHTFDGVTKIPYRDTINTIQNYLFTLQAEIGGSEKRLTQEHVAFLEKIIGEIDTLIPPIKSFIIPGGGETGAYLDLARTVARRAERNVIIAIEKEGCTISKESLSFLNRLSSVLYALARFANYQEGYSDRAPLYG